MSLENLNKTCLEILKEQKRVIIAMSGLGGSGKSTLGKQIRKNGFGSFKPYQIAVIDDDVMSLNLFFIRPKIKFKNEDGCIDDLKPFFRFLPPFIKLVFYINKDLNRLSKADILVFVSTDEATRKARLNKREKDINKIEKLLETKTNTDIKYKYRIDFML
ncbi:hypothetical protein CMCT_0294 [Campylobacter mucosalis]|uniref:Phosphoribulokinase/uridine kinase domain-containing protein n=1 Tax=Campylobacter mucosalis CCUG 21559 TaxID=1032067 RepID=A0A6G5QFN1_9BACT|nr:hypothetical protein [Campylobacter mucosalis]QCD44495.1 hypothetical protein CMUC_0698 [Campylobacter mucosalis CCUG 21559]QKF62461.1 hypothetical protein CMCT_0294 [Campylobacter mucosalis]